MQCLPKLLKFFIQNRSLSCIGNGNRFVSSYTPNRLHQVTNNFSNDFKTLAELWKKNSKSADFHDYLFKCFSRDLDCYSFTIDLIKFTNQVEFDNLKELNFAIIFALDGWLKKKPDEQPLSLELKKKALETMLEHKDSDLSKIMSRVFKLQDDSKYLREYADKLIAAGKFEMACDCVIALQIQNEIHIDKILLPLAFRRRTGPIVKYLHGYEDLQVQLAKRIDSILGATLQDNEFRALRIKENKILYKCLSSLITVFDINIELCPNLLKIRTSGTLNQLLLKREQKSISESSFETIVVDLISKYPYLQKRLVRRLASSGSDGLALRMAQKFNISPDQLPPGLSETSQDDLICSTEVENCLSSDMKNNEDSPVAYLMLDTDKVAVQFVENEQEFFDCLNDIIQNHKVVGIDSEWKAQFGLKPLRLSLMQLAVSDKVYILDMLSLDKCLLKENWDSFIELLFSNSKILKLGCGIIQDVQMLLEDYRGTLGKTVYFSNVLDISVLFEKVREMYKVELEDFASDPPGTKGLSKLCQIILGKPLNKEERICDWEIRPLSDSQITYAALDAYCLLQMLEKIKKRAEERLINFDEAKNVSIDMTAGISKIVTTKGKARYRWERQRYSFFFQPAITILDFKIVLDHSLAGLGTKLRMFGVDATILQESQTYNDGVKIARDENRIFFTTQEDFPKAKAVLPEGKVYNVGKLASWEEKTVAYIFKKFNVHMTSKAIYSRCMKCNGDQFVPVPSDELKKMWVTAHSQDDDAGHHSEKSADCGNEEQCYQYEEITIKPSGEMNSGVQIQLEELPLNLFSQSQTFQICKSCGHVHYQR